MNTVIHVGIIGFVFIVSSSFGPGAFSQTASQARRLEEEKRKDLEGSELKEIKQSIIYPLESFVVNLMDKSESGKRYLKTTIELDVMGQEGLDLIEPRKAQLRDAILLLLTSQSFMEINTIEGKLELKRAILLRINQVLSEKVVNNIYFTEFVVQ